MNKVALITGVAGGIGHATAAVFRAEDWHVIGVDKNPEAEPAEVDHFIHADISEVEASQQIFREIHEREGQIDALINNAAIQIAKPLVETEPDEWDAVMASNLRSVYLGIRHAYPLMKGRHAAIINVSSVHAIATSANIASYAASKGALLALTRALAIELAPDIRVNAILPGAVDTPMLRAGLSRGHLEMTSVEKQLDELSQRTVMGRVGEPEEIGQSILFLADETRSSFMTGQALIVDGGATTKLSTE